MKIPPFEPINSDVEIMVTDLESLSKVTFMKCIETAREKYKTPKDFFQSIGIIIPEQVKRWGDIEAELLIEIKQLTCQAKKVSKLKTIIVSSKGRIEEHD